MSAIIEATSEAKQIKDELDLLDFNEQINLIRDLRLCWNFDSDYEENTEHLVFTADDDSTITIAINDNEKTVSCEL